MSEKYGAKKDSHDPESTGPEVNRTLLNNLAKRCESCGHTVSNKFIVTDRKGRKVCLGCVE